MRMVAEAACSRMFSPCSSSLDLDALQRVDNVQELKGMVKRTLADPTLFADMSEQDVVRACILSSTLLRTVQRCMLRSPVQYSQRCCATDA